MGSWQPVISDADRQRYNTLLASSNQAYATANMDGLNRLLGERGGRAYLYSETDPAAFQILLLLTPAPNEPAVWKIVNAVPMGDYDPAAAVRIAWRQVRRILDEVGADSFFGTPLRDYGDSKMNAFFKEVPAVCWELEAEESAENGKFRYTFRRAADRKVEDERFEGPQSRAQAAAKREA